MKAAARQTQVLTHPFLTFIEVVLLAVVAMNGASLLAQAALGADAASVGSLSAGSGWVVAGEGIPSLVGDIAGAIAMLVAIGVFFPWEFGGRAGAQGRGQRCGAFKGAADMGFDNAPSDGPGDGGNRLVVLFAVIGVAMVVAGGISAALTIASFDAVTGSIAGEEDVLAEPMAGGEAVVWTFDVPTAVVALAVMCIATAIFEEGLFRGAAIPCFARLFQKDTSRDDRLGEGALGGEASHGVCAAHGETSHGEIATGVTPLSFQALLKAAVLSAVLFGLLHCGLGEAGVAVAGSASGVPSGGATAILAAWVFGRFLQTSLFGLAMAAVFMVSRTIWPVVAFHALYDFVYFAPVVLITGAPLQNFMVFPFLGGETLALTSIIFGTIAIVLFVAIYRRGISRRNSRANRTADIRHK